MKIICWSYLVHGLDDRGARIWGLGGVGGLPVAVEADGDAVQTGEHQDAQGQNGDSDVENSKL